MILITGGAGFIGANYLYKLYKENPTNEAICVDALTYASNIDYIRPLIDCGFVKLIVQNISNEIWVEYLLKKYQPEYIVHFAAESHVDNSIKDLNPFVETNIVGTINLLKHSVNLPSLKKFVHVSTDEVYGSLGLDEGRSFNELSHYEPNSPYSASKAASDCFVRAFYKTYGVPAIITNCSNNYGPNQHKEKLIPTILHNALAGRSVPVYGQGLNVRDWLYVDDHCDGINLVLEKGLPGERYNIGGGTEIANIDLVKKILGIINKPEDLIEFVLDRPGHDLRYSIDCTKIKRELGYSPKHNLEEGLIKTIEWYKKNV